MIHYKFPTQIGLYNDVTTIEDNKAIQEWILKKLNGSRFTDIDRENDHSVETTFVKNMFLVKLKEYINETVYDFDKDTPFLTDLFSNRCFKYTQETEEWNSPYILHNDLVDGDITLIYYPFMPIGLGSDLMFYSPHSMAVFNHYDTMQYTPAERDIIIFPSHILHKVTPYWGDLPRVSITAVYKFEKLKKTSRPYETISNTNS